MPIPIIIFLYAWLAIVAIFGLIAIMAAMQTLRFGMAGITTTGITFVFLGVGLAVSLITAAYLTRIDWTKTFNPLDGITTANIFESPITKP